MKKECPVVTLNDTCDHELFFPQMEQVDLRKQMIHLALIGHIIASLLLHFQASDVLKVEDQRIQEGSVIVS